MNCYNFVEYNFDKGLFDNSIDATYVIHLENNGRINKVIEQIYKYKPTRKIYILYNKGFKNCNKLLTKNVPDKDLVHCNLTIFKHAKLNNYNNILVLEDDFIFSDKIKNKDILEHLNIFLNDHINEKFIYYIGAGPNFSVPYKKNHYKPFLITMAHSNIYSKNTREYILNNENDASNSWHLWDVYINDLSSIIKYHYKYPLCYQLFTETENSKYWKISNNKFINWFIIGFGKYYFKIINLDKTPEPGFTILYTLSILSFYIFIFFIIYMIYKYIQLRKKKINV